MKLSGKAGVLERDSCRQNEHPIANLNSDTEQWEYARELQEPKNLTYRKFRTSCRDHSATTQLSDPEDRATTTVEASPQRN